MPALIAIIMLGTIGFNEDVNGDGVVNGSDVVGDLSPLIGIAVAGKVAGF